MYVEWHVRIGFCDEDREIDEAPSRVSHVLSVAY